MSKRLGRFCMITGTVLVVSALSLALWNRNTDIKGKEASQKVLVVLSEEIAENQAENEKIEENMGTPTGDDLFAEYEEEIKTETIVEVDGNGYLGVVTLPALDIELPVMSEWSYPGLKKAPCRYKGSYISDDMIICAHNYNSHFGGIRNMNTGDPVDFTDCEGNVYNYEVVQIDEINGGDIEAMEAGEWELTLFTCTYGGKSRVTIRCRLLADEEEKPLYSSTITE